MTSINIRVEKTTKEKAAATFDKLGLDMSSAVKLFLHQAIKENGLPFTPTNNPEVIKARWDEEATRTLKHGKRFSSAHELHKTILK